MISRDLRIRLEGSVEELESLVTELNGALRAARRQEFGPAARVLPQVSRVRAHHGDQGLAELLERFTTLRTELIRRVTEKLTELGMPVIDPVRGAQWLCDEPVRYSHHRVSTGGLLRGPHAALFVVGSSTAIGTAAGAPLLGLFVGTSLFFWWLIKFNWSDVELTEHRAVIEGVAVELAGLRRLKLVRPLWTVFPLEWKLELHYRGRLAPDVVTIRHVPVELRNAFQKLEINTGPDWGPM